MITKRENCSCGAAIGEPHYCDFARCMWTGQQLCQCEDGLLTIVARRLIDLGDRQLSEELQDQYALDLTHDCGVCIFDGYYPGEQEAAEYGWYSRFDHGWVSTTEDDPRGNADLNRVMAECDWDRDRQRWVRRT